MEIIVIGVTKKFFNKQTYFFIHVNDISDYQTAGLMKMQHLFQKTLTNGLSHERLTPLNGIILNTELVLHKIETLKGMDPSNFKNDDSSM